MTGHIIFLVHRFVRALVVLSLRLRLLSHHLVRPAEQRAEARRREPHALQEGVALPLVKVRVRVRVRLKGVGLGLGLGLGKG